MDAGPTSGMFYGRSGRHKNVRSRLMYCTKRTGEVCGSGSLANQKKRPGAGDDLFSSPKRNIKCPCSGVVVV